MSQTFNYTFNSGSGPLTLQVTASSTLTNYGAAGDTTVIGNGYAITSISGTLANGDPVSMTGGSGYSTTPTEYDNIYFGSDTTQGVYGSTDGIDNAGLLFQDNQTGNIYNLWSANGNFELDQYTSGGILTSSTEVTLASYGSVPCYMRGTRIRTVSGEVAVEDLRAGDLVVTASGATRPVVWTGHRAIHTTHYPDSASVWPVRVAAGAFGEGLPKRDLWLSPGHNIVSEGVLMPVSALIDGVSIAQVETEKVEYWHVELDAHDIVLAEGLPAESYLDCGNRPCFANGGAFVVAHPDFKPKHWSETCLPLVGEGPEVARTKARLSEHLAAQGYASALEADARQRA